jgi:hypothetical protein
MAPQLNASQHILVNTLLKEGFKNKLLASEALCSVPIIMNNSSLETVFARADWIDKGRRTNFVVSNRPQRPLNSGRTK